MILLRNLILHAFELLAFNCFYQTAINCSLPSSSSHSDNDYMEYLDQLLFLYDLYINKGPCCFVGDFNAAIGKQGRPRGFEVVNARKLIEFLDYFNLVTITLFELIEGQLHSYMSDDDRHKSMIDYIVLSVPFIGKVNSCVVGEW